ncbi:diaminopimelate decarboxylase [Burkholderia pseudomallei]|nr:diaminopimelate decarboxylase [Burkholderia pseudomallei]
MTIGRVSHRRALAVHRAMPAAKRQMSRACALLVLSTD